MQEERSACPSSHLWQERETSAALASEARRTSQGSGRKQQGYQCLVEKLKNENSYALGRGKKKPKSTPNSLKNITKPLSFLSKMTSSSGQSIIQEKALIACSSLERDTWIWVGLNLWPHYTENIFHHVVSKSLLFAIGNIKCFINCRSRKKKIKTKKQNWKRMSIQHTILTITKLTGNKRWEDPSYKKERS